MSQRSTVREDYTDVSNTRRWCQLVVAQGKTISENPPQLSPIAKDNKKYFGSVSNTKNRHQLVQKSPGQNRISKNLSRLSPIAEDGITSAGSNMRDLHSLY
ncbi:hypothetical protein AVEN_126093-1 [Araneus ventricosus]|uniref:Uncharacterized protein n=1 Tax=Araneus ventricosus TaxID=182803 RepID=A0A4Y2CKI4_ARAVE|nr:hypothetical protein AVEN_126093-1 [Araneus ventricosus]